MAGHCFCAPFLAPAARPCFATPRKLPTILSADEVVRFLKAVASLKTCTALTTAYAAGLRALDAVSLRVADIDSDRILIQVRHGKGAKDRTLMPLPQLTGILLAAGAADGLAVPRSRRQAGRRAGAPFRLPVRD